MALTIFTNGTLIDEANADRIAALRPMGVEISLLGGIPATHDAIARRRGAFEKTIAGVRRLRARGTPVLLKTVLMRKNVVERAAMQAIADSLGCNLLVDVEVSPKDDGSLGPKAFVADDDALIAAMRALVEDQAAKYGPPEEISREERLEGVPCAAGRRTCQIGPTGDVFPCTQWKEPIGNVRATSFRELWDHSEAFERIRATRIKDIPICSECDLIDTCTPCMALGLLEVGVIGPSPTKCAAAELRAKADGHSGRSAWFLKLERDALASGGALRPDRPRVRLPLVG
jgi:mycofactocin biosynthetic radical S-adenosylmethionine protein MftC